MLPGEKLNVQNLLIMKPFKITILLTALAAMVGCGSQGPISSLSPDALEERAQQLVLSGNLDQAVQIYTQLINSSNDSARSRFLIDGSRVLIQLQNYTLASRWLNRARTTSSVKQEQQVFLLLAEIDILVDSPTAALETLKNIPQPYTDEVIAAIQVVRGSAFFKMGRVEEAISTLVQRELSLKENSQILDNHRIIWAGLMEQEQEAMLLTAENSIIDGWLKLQSIALASKTNPLGLRTNLLEWRESHLDHPAAQILILDLLMASQSMHKNLGQIAILLPFSGAQQAIARAIRDGFMAAHFNHSLLAAEENKTTLKFYDTSLMGPEEAYFRAQIDGADFVVGPLLKPELQEIINSTGFVPTLALNSIESEQLTASHIYQFALAPEDEAREVARHAISNGSLKAVAIIQNSDWGLRLLSSFREEFESLGGELIQFRGYDLDTQDFSNSITTLLNISESNQRHQRLVANLALPLGFEPRRRQDIDMIFVAADASAGRLLFPQLRFHYAGNIPTYATSAIHESVLNEPDLNGVVFPDTPWVLLESKENLELKQSLETYWPQRRSPPWARFYGFGFDAYRLVPLLYEEKIALSSIDTLSGTLSLDQNRRISRGLPLAQFRNGRPFSINSPTP